MPLPSNLNKTIAVVDVGSNSTHLVIAKVSNPGVIRIIDSEKFSLKLGEAISVDGNLTTESIEKTVAVLRFIQQIISPYDALTRIVATHAIREALNSNILLQRIEEITNLKVDIIDGHEEARICYLGMRQGLSLENRTCLGVDIGGGSTEIIIACDDNIKFVSSFKLGCVTLTNKYLNINLYNKQSILKLVEAARECLKPLRNVADQYNFTQAIASSGTAKTLAQIHAQLQNIQPSRELNGYKLTRDDVFALAASLAEFESPEKISEKTGVDEQRAKVLLAGAIILSEVTKQLRIDEWTISSFGLREGLIADTMQHHSGQPFSGLQNSYWPSVLEVAKRFKTNQIHSEQVKRLAFHLYGSLKPQLTNSIANNSQLEALDLKLLETAAYLREVGKFISVNQYHKHTHYILSNLRLPGLTEAEKTALSLIARFQRKQYPNEANCPELSITELRRLQHLTACLRLAAALDRSKQQKVIDLSTKIVNNTLIIEIYFDPKNPPEIELYKAESEVEYLQKNFNLSIALRPQPLKSQK